MVAYKLLSRYPGIAHVAKVGDYLTLDLHIDAYTNRFQTTNQLNPARNIYTVPRKYVEGYGGFFKKCKIQIKVEEV